MGKRSKGLNPEPNCSLIETSFFKNIDLNNRIFMYNTGNYIQNPMTNHLGDFPDGPLFKNLPANAGDTDLIPGPARSHMPWGQLSWRIATTEACAS